MITENTSLALIPTFLWTGFVLAISFMEAWLKFRAPGVTLPIGLGIGRLVFKTMNRVEWVFAVVIGIDGLANRGGAFLPGWLFYAVPVALLLLQTVWALPALDARAELHIRGQYVPSSRLHVYYVVMETVKVTCLFMFGITLLKQLI